MSEAAIRRAQISDVPALLEIYNHYVVNTHVTFDVEPRTLEQRLAWFGAFQPQSRHQCFVATRGVETIGWASSGPFKERTAYDSSVETSVYLAPDATGRGIGRRLYETLFAALAAADVHRAYGAIAEPNDASTRLHKAMAFRRVGAYREVGRKFGRFWNVAIYERAMATRP